VIEYIKNIFKWFTGFFKKDKKYSISELKEKLTIGTEVKLNKGPMDGIDNYLPNPSEFVSITPHKILSYFYVVGWSDDILFVKGIEGNNRSVVDTSNSSLRIFVPNHPTIPTTDINPQLKIEEVYLHSNMAGQILKLVGNNAEIEVLVRKVKVFDNTEKMNPSQLRKKLSTAVYSFKVKGELLQCLMEDSQITFSFENEYTARKVNILKQHAIEGERAYMESMRAIINDDVERIEQKPNIGV
jgi:hypothetical protein